MMKFGVMRIIAMYKESLEVLKQGIKYYTGPDYVFHCVGIGNTYLWNRKIL